MRRIAETDDQETAEVALATDKPIKVPMRRGSLGWNTIFLTWRRIFRLEQNTRSEPSSTTYGNIQLVRFHLQLVAPTVGLPGRVHFMFGPFATARAKASDLWDTEILSIIQIVNADCYRQPKSFLAECKIDFNHLWVDHIILAYFGSIQLLLLVNSASSSTISRYSWRLVHDAPYTKALATVT